MYGDILHPPPLLYMYVCMVRCMYNTYRQRTHHPIPMYHTDRQPDNLAPPFDNLSPTF